MRGTISRLHLGRTFMAKFRKDCPAERDTS
jgi:hypothetical protein